MSAIDTLETNWRAGARFEPVHRTRVFDLNVDDSAISEGAETILLRGTGISGIDFVDGAIVLANDAPLESNFAAKLHLRSDDPGSYCDCDLPEMGDYTSEKIDIALDDLDSGDALQWQRIVVDR